MNIYRWKLSRISNIVRNLSVLTRAVSELYEDVLMQNVADTL